MTVITKTTRKTLHLHPRDRLRCQIKKEKDNVFISNRPLHPRNRFRRQTKEGRDDGDVIYVNKRPQHSRDRLKQKNKKLEFDAETLTEIPFINIDVLLNARVLPAHENIVIDHMIRNLLTHNDRHCIKHKEGSSTIKRRSLTERKGQIIQTNHKNG